MSDKLPTIEFVASLPPIQSAINLDGRGDGGRVKLDIPATDVGALLLLQHHFSGKAFRVTIEVDRSGESDDRTIGRRKAKRRNTEGNTGV